MQIAQVWELLIACWSPWSWISRWTREMTLIDPSQQKKSSSKVFRFDRKTNRKAHAMAHALGRMTLQWTLHWVYRIGEQKLCSFFVHRDVITWSVDTTSIEVNWPMSSTIHFACDWKVSHFTSIVSFSVHVERENQFFSKRCGTILIDDCLLCNVSMLE